MTREEVGLEIVFSVLETVACFSVSFMRLSSQFPFMFSVARVSARARDYEESRGCKEATQLGLWR